MRACAGWLLQPLVKTFVSQGDSLISYANYIQFKIEAGGPRILQDKLILLFIFFATNIVFNELIISY